jgi:hypothetical protein
MSDSITPKEAQNETAPRPRGEWALLNCFPETFRKIILDIFAYSKFDIEGIALLLMTNIGAAVGSHVMNLTPVGYKTRPTLQTFVLGPVSSGKTLAHEYVSGPWNMLQARANRDYTLFTQDKESHVSEVEQAISEVERAMNDKPFDGENPVQEKDKERLVALKLQKAAIERLNCGPTVLTDDSNTAALATTLYRNGTWAAAHGVERFWLHHFLFLLSGEGQKILQLYTGAGTVDGYADTTVLCKGYDWDSMHVTRVGNQNGMSATSIFSVCLPVCVAVAEGIAEDFLNSKKLRADGSISRFNIFSGTACEFHSILDPRPSSAIEEEYCKIIFALHDLRKQPKQIVVPLDHEAAVILDAYGRVVHAKMHGGPWSDVKEMVGRFAQKAGRFALILCLMKHWDDIRKARITKEIAADAVLLADFYHQHQLDLFAVRRTAMQEDKIEKIKKNLIAAGKSGLKPSEAARYAGFGPKKEDAERTWKLGIKKGLIVLVKSWNKSQENARLFWKDSKFAEDAIAADNEVREARRKENLCLDHSFDAIWPGPTAPEFAQPTETDPGKTAPPDGTAQEVA